MLAALLSFYALGMLLMFAHNVETGKPTDKAGKVVRIVMWPCFGGILGFFAILKSLRGPKTDC